MARLRQAFIDMGFANVSTYINSGNVIFTASTTPDQQVIADKLATTFGFDIPVLIVSAKQLATIVAAIPASWQNDYTEQNPM